MFVQADALVDRVPHQRAQVVQPLGQEQHDGLQVERVVRHAGRDDLAQLDLAGRAPGHRARRRLPQPIDGAIGDAAGRGQVPGAELQHAAAGRRSAHDPVRHSHRIQDVQAKQRDMRRLHQVAAGVEHQFGRLVRLVLRAEARQQIRAAVAAGTARGRRAVMAPKPANPVLRRALSGLRDAISSRAMVSMKRGSTPYWHFGMQCPLPEHTAAHRAASACSPPRRMVRMPSVSLPGIGRVDSGRRRHRAHLRACPARHTTLQHLRCPGLHREIEGRDVHLVLPGWLRRDRMPEILASFHPGTGRCPPAWLAWTTGLGYQ